MILYPLALAAALGTFVWTLTHAAPADITLLRGTGAPYTIEPDGRIVNPIRIRITNRSTEPRAYRIALAGDDGAGLVAPFNPLNVAPAHTATTMVFVQVPLEEFRAGVHTVTFRIGDGSFESTLPYPLVGPQRAEHP